MNASQLNHACELRMRGASYRQLAKSLGVPRSTLHYHLKRRLGEDRLIRHGSLAVIEEYLNSKLLTPAQKADVRRWLAGHSGEILKIDSRSDRRLLTWRAENRLTREQCGSTLDYRCTIEGGSHAA